jgi:hypothetical protein
MADQKLHAILGVTPRKPLIAQTEIDEDNDYQACSYGRVGTRAAEMICFIKSDGYHFALPYMELRSVMTANPADGFEMEFSTQRIIIEGRNLEVPFRYVRENRLVEIVEAVRTHVLCLSDNESVVTRLDVRSLQYA